MNSSSSNGEANSAVGSESPRSHSISLQAAATMNAGFQHEHPRRSSSSSISRHRQSPATGRRRSTVLMNLQLNDPSVPGPGEMQEGSGAPYTPVSPQPLSGSPLLAGRDPHHNRAPSLGELHQELEAEQEAQVNRLLQMIRQQQLQLQQLQASQGQSQTSVAAEDATSTSGLSAPPSHTPLPASTPRSPVMAHPRSSIDTNRSDLRPSRTPSRQTSSPRMRSASISTESAEPFLLGGRDESAFYQAETQSMVRENQMLRHRIRELERQLSDAHSATTVTREPAHPSHLLESTSVAEEGGAQAAPPGAVADASKDEV
ncbi:hypothetical protein BJ170DRAFT_680063 [Xylariales sp. AK1849]|nr:hypothetical protein BJ170DRAFT_680063 [Xylariales sp. AK1849]